MAKNEASIAEVVREMSTGTSERYERERQQAQKAEQKARDAEEVEVAKRIAVAQLDERDRRDRDWCYSNLGDLTDHELRRLIRRQHGFEPI
jgi:hypothetical protein